MDPEPVQKSISYIFTVVELVDIYGHITVTFKIHYSVPQLLFVRDILVLFQFVLSTTEIFLSLKNF